MRVVFVANAAPVHNAVGNLLAEKVAFFLERHAEVHVLLQSTANLHPHLHGLASENASPVTHGPAWDSLMQADLVFFTYSQGFPLLDWLPLLAGRGVRLVVEYLGVTPVDGWPGPQREALEQGLRQRHLVWFADHALVLSRFSQDELSEASGYPQSRITMLEPPLDLERWQPAESRPGRERPVLLFVGRLAPNKRLELAIEALAELPAELWIVGDSGDVYADQARRGRELAARLGVGDRIRWLDSVPDAELPSLYRQADVLVMPSVHEGFGIPVREAQASGTPVVAAHATALPETVGDAGLTFVPDDRADFVRQLRRALDPTEAAELRRRGLDRVRTACRLHWRQSFARLVEKVLVGAPLAGRREVVLRPVAQPILTLAGSPGAFVPLRVENRSDWPILEVDPGRVSLAMEVHDARTGQLEGEATAVHLPATILPGREGRATVMVPTPAREGAFVASLWPVDPAGKACGSAVHVAIQVRPRLTSVPESDDRNAWLASAQAAVAGALTRSVLPTDYLDISEGRFARVKRWLKAKILHNFRHGYVDVLSRQQSQVNRQLIEALEQLGQYCRTLDEAVRHLEQRLYERVPASVADMSPDRQLALNSGGKARGTEAPDAPGVPLPR